MSGSVNKVILVGRVGKDPEIRSTQDGREIASFSLATSESWKDKQSGERKEKTEWSNIAVMNGNIVGVVKNYVKKGSLLYLEGSLQTRKWQDKQGQDRYSTEVVLQGFSCQLVMLSRVERDEDSQPQQRATSSAASPAPAAELLDDEIPFAFLFACATSASMLMMQFLDKIPSAFYG
jgi:single-strand DNA-binding protein